MIKVSNGSVDIVIKNVFLSISWPTVSAMAFIHMNTYDEPCAVNRKIKMKSKCVPKNSCPIPLENNLD